MALFYNPLGTLCIIILKRYEYIEMHSSWLIAKFTGLASNPKFPLSSFCPENRNQRCYFFKFCYTTLYIHVSINVMYKFACGHPDSNTILESKYGSNTSKQMTGLYLSTNSLSIAIFLFISLSFYLPFSFLFSFSLSLVLCLMMLLKTLVLMGWGGDSTKVF